MSENRFAVITGGSRGIGLGVAQYLAKQQYNLALIATDPHRLDNAKASIQADNPDITISTHPIDISDSQQAYTLMQQLIDSNSQRIDVLFNNAGIAMNGCMQMSITDFERIQAVNVNGMFAVAKAVAEAMQRQGSGYIINLASIAGKETWPFLGGYCASKFAMVGFSEALFKEMLPHNVKVTAICPSVVDTDMARDFDTPDDEKILVDDIVKTVDWLLQLSPNAVISSVDVRCRCLEIKEV